MSIKLVFPLILFCNIFYSQPKFNLDLKKELDSIYKSDQIIREYINSKTLDLRKSQIEIELGYKFENIQEAYIKMIKNDSTNIKRIEYLINNYGYAGKSMVGEPTNETMWYIIQHSDKIKKYYPIIRTAGKKNELPKKLVAKMYDRILINDGKEQIYGTQGRIIYIRNKITGKEEFFKYILPIKNSKKVNKRRKRIGFTTTVEENASQIGIDYIKYTYKDLQKIFKENDIIN